jgi:hypothetical protein
MSRQPRWTAKCWLGSRSGYVDIEVNANTIGGAKEQLQSIYGAQQVINLRRVHEGGSGSSMPAGTSIWLIGILGAGALFLYFTPWVLMAIYGGLATWVSEQLTGQSIQEYTDTPDSETTESQHKKAMITFGAALLLGGVGFVQGTFINKDLNVEYNLDGKQTKVEQVRPQNNAK